MKSLLLGAHQSISGGIYKAVEKAIKLNTNVLQIFTKNSNRWNGKKIQKNDLKKYFKLINSNNIIYVIAHSAYLINLASDNEEIINKSIAALKEEIKNCSLLNIEYLVMHPGSHKGAGEDIGINRVSDNLNRLFNELPFCNVKILLETTAGQGNSIGYKLEHLCKIREKVKNKENIYYCLDTCHLFAAGYDFRNKYSYLKLKEQIDNILGLENVKVLHLNDSKKELGSRIDRHEHIGKGKIGIKGFSFFVNDEYFAQIPMIIETPKENDMDKKNIILLKSI